MNPLSRSQKIGIAVIVLGLGLAVGIAWLKLRGPAEPFRVVVAEQGILISEILATGVVEPSNRLELKPPIAGRVERVMVPEGAYVRKGQLLAWMSSSERAALLDAAAAKGPAELARWEALYTATPILAPISGRVILRNVEPGQSFTTSDAVFVMSDRLAVKAQVDETDIGRVSLKQQAILTLDAYPSQPFPGVVEQIAFDAKTVNNVTTYPVDVIPTQVPEFMRSGMTASVAFAIANTTPRVLLPIEAVRSREGKNYVVLDTGSHASGPATERGVTLGTTDGKRVEILSGLAAGESVRIAVAKPTSANARAGSPFGPMGGRPSGSRRP